MKTITKEMQESMISDLEEWQKVENATIASTGEVMASTDNPVVRIVMEIIQQDSLMHHRVQAFIRQTLDGTAIRLTPEDLEAIWDQIEKHVELEQKTIELAEKTLESIEGKYMVIQQYLLEYLLEDEAKHTNMLRRLDEIKRKMYPYG